MSRSLFTPVSLSAVAFALSACAATHANPSDAEPPPVSVKLSTAHPQALDVVYRASASVRGRTSAVLTSKLTGYVRSIEVRPGDRVKAGQTLAILEANATAAGVRRARAGYAQSLDSRGEAESGLHAAQAALSIARSNAARVRELYSTHAISKQEYDESEARLEGAQAAERMAEARVRASDSRIEQAKAEVSEASAMLGDARISAPFDGTVIERRVDPGVLAAPGMPLLVLEEEDRLRVETAVDESKVKSIRLGDSASVELEALSEPALAKVSEIVPAVDAASRAFLVKLDLPDGLSGLRPGMFARVAFRVGSRDKLVVPSTAIRSLGALDRVLAVEGDRLRLRMVTLGEQQGPWSEVLSGLSAGERVVISSNSAAIDGARFQEQP